MFTLENRKPEEGLNTAYAESFSKPPAQPSLAEMPSPPAAEKSLTKRPDPQSYLNEKQSALQEAQSMPLLQLDEAETVERGPDAPAPKRRARRAKTRLLGVDGSGKQIEDVIAAQDPQPASAPITYRAVGWLVVVEGPGCGHSMPLRTGASQVGRGDDQTVQLDFGDTSISRQNHASIAFDEEQRAFFIGHGGKANLVRLNEAPVLSTERLKHGDKIRIGETTLQLVAFCGDDFSWADQSPTEASEPVVPVVDSVPASVVDAAPATLAALDPKVETVATHPRPMGGDELEFRKAVSRPLTE